MLTAEEKCALLSDTMLAHDLRVFVETGTHDGDTVASVRKATDCEAYTIEMGEDYFDRAAMRFAHDTRVRTLFGNSGALLPNVLGRFDCPALIWLDAHPGEIGTAGTYGETPLRAELHAIFDAPTHKHVVLIDDARLLGEPGWPTLDEIRAIVEPTGWTVTEADDIVRCMP
jgi:hypothetical protein